MSLPEVLVLRLQADARLPERQTEGAAGYDIAAAGPATIPARGWAVVGTGLALQLPPGVEAQVRPRSGLAARHGIGLLNAPGTLDSDYRGELKVVLFNLSDQEFRIAPGERIAQLVFARTTGVQLREADRLDTTPRGSGGFGSTGK